MNLTFAHGHLCPPPCEIYSVPSTEPILPRESSLVRRGLDWKGEHMRSGAPGTETSPLSPFANIAAAPPCPWRPLILFLSTCFWLLQRVVEDKEEDPFLLNLDCTELRCRTGNKTFSFPLKQ